MGAPSSTEARELAPITSPADAVRRLVMVYRERCWRDLPGARRWTLYEVVSGLTILGFLAFLGAILTRSLYLGNDSAHSYARVWFLQEAIYRDHWIPLRIPVLEAGRALTFPYGIIPWLPTAVLRPVFGDWAVTASLLGGALFLVAGVWHWLPRMRSPLLTAILLLNPQLYGGLAQFQLPTFWALGFACFAAGEFSRARTARGTSLAVLALYAHPLTGGAALFASALANAESERRMPYREAVGIAIAVVLAAPAIWMLFATPLVRDVGFGMLSKPLWLTLKRVSVVGWAWALSRFAPTAVRAWPLVFLVAAVAVGNDVRHAPPVGLWEASEPRFADFVADDRVSPYAVYRVLTTTRHEDGMYELMRAGATLGQDFFDESVWRYSFGDTHTYRCFLGEKRVDRVLVSGEWASLQWSDEVRMLDGLVREGGAALTYRGAAGTLEYTLHSGSEPTGCGPRLRR